MGLEVKRLGDKNPCAGKIMRHFFEYSCARSGTVQEAGKWWCKSHAPSLVEARRGARQEQWEQERVANRERRNREALKEAVLKEIPTEMLQEIVNRWGSIPVEELRGLLDFESDLLAENKKMWRAIVKLAAAAGPSWTPAWVIDRIEKEEGE